MLVFNTYIVWGMIMIITQFCISGLRIRKFNLAVSYLTL